MNGINQALGSMVDAVRILADKCDMKGVDSNVVDFCRRVDGVRIEESLARISKELRIIISEYSVYNVDNEDSK